VVVHPRKWLSAVLLGVFLSSTFVNVGFAATASTTRKTSATKKKTAQARRHSSPRVRRMRQAFVASARLKPMARQLLQDRTPAAYAGVEGYARKHAKEDAGALAWLVLGYAHILDHDYAKAVDPLNRAKAKAGDLGDYVNYYLASSYSQTGHAAEAIPVLSEFDKNYPDSLLLRDAHVLYANLLLSDNRAQESASLLEKYRQPVRAEVELALGRAYAASGQPTKAIAIFRNLYFNMPVSPEADQAEGELAKLSVPGSPQPSFGDRKTRADLLLKGKRYSEAASAYSDLLNEASPSDRPVMQLAMATALRRAGRSKDAKKAFESLSGLPVELEGERLFNLGEIARSNDDEDGFFRYLGQLRQTVPTSTWLEQALLSAGNICLLKPDYDRAIDFYRELQQRFPSGSRAAYAHWKVAWLSLRQGRNAEAKQQFEQQIALYPASAEAPAALYWRGRLAEEDNDAPTARAYYQKVSSRFQNYYYGELARRRLAKVKKDDDPVHIAILDRIPSIDSNSRVTPDPVPTDNLRVQKAQLLENGALADFSVRELQAAANEEKGNWLPGETARLYQDMGRYDVALDVMKRAVPNYFSLDISSLPRPYWEVLFPKPFWPDLKRFSSNNALDPYMVASLIRQESAFNPNAVSRKDAVGLMQLLPKTGKLVAKQEKVRHFAPTQLFTPGTNLQLGTRYFRGMVDKFGAFEYALAAYNAGSDRVDDWLKLGKYRDPQEFVESIPFTETREYVQAILRNENLYRQLYGTP
jgi:soluble lytic murein transglycosylase